MQLMLLYIDFNDFHFNSVYYYEYNNYLDNIVHIYEIYFIIYLNGSPINYLLTYIQVR
jgi:hypothetical protein